jgi:hypothetical protein
VDAAILQIVHAAEARRVATPEVAERRFGLVAEQPGGAR